MALAGAGVPSPVAAPPRPSRATTGEAMSEEIRASGTALLELLERLNEAIVKRRNTAHITSWSISVVSDRGVVHESRPAATTENPLLPQRTAWNALWAQIDIAAKRFLASLTQSEQRGNPIDKLINLRANGGTEIENSRGESVAFVRQILRTNRRNAEADPQNAQRCQLAAFQSFKRAVDSPNGPASQKLKTVYEWIEIHDPDSDYRLPSFETWSRQVRAARQAMKQAADCSPRGGRTGRSIVAQKDT